MSEDSVDERYSEMFEEKHDKMLSSGLDWTPVFTKLVAVAAGFIVDLYLFAVALYIVIGDSLAVRVGEERWSLHYLGVVFLWPFLLIVDAVPVGGDAS